MAIRIRCPQCGQDYTVNDRNAGKRTKCVHCGQEFRVPADAKPVVRAAPVPEPVPAPPAPEWEGPVDDPPEPDREPERPRYRDEEPDYRPRRRMSGLAVTGVVVWSITAAIAVGVGLMWLVMVLRVSNDISLAAVSATAAAALVGVYVIARSVEKIFAAIRQRG